MFPLVRVPTNYQILLPKQLLIEVRILIRSFILQNLSRVAPYYYLWHFLYLNSLFQAGYGANLKFGSYQIFQKFATRIYLANWKVCIVIFHPSFDETYPGILIQSQNFFDIFRISWIDFCLLEPWNCSKVFILETNAHKKCQAHNFMLLLSNRLCWVSLSQLTFKDNSNCSWS